MFKKKLLLTTLIWLICISTILASQESTPQDNSLLGSKINLCIKEYNASKSTPRTQSINHLITDITKKHQDNLTDPQVKYLFQQVTRHAQDMLLLEVEISNSKKEACSECIRAGTITGLVACLSGGIAMLGILTYPFNLAGGLTTLSCGSACCGITGKITEEISNNFFIRQEDDLQAQIYSLREQPYQNQPQIPTRPESDGSLARRILGINPKQITMQITPTTTAQEIQPPHQLQ